MENLVDRFCAKFKLNEDPKTCANITYCLTLINYNEKALGRLLDNFGLYKHLLHDSDIYGMFKQIINNANRSGKPTIKVISCFNSLFSLITDKNGWSFVVFAVTGNF